MKLGPISPRFKAEIEGAIQARAYETLQVTLPDPEADEQRNAAAAFVTTAMLQRIALSLPPSASVPLTLLRQDLFDESFLPYVTADEVGFGADVLRSGQLGVFTANRPGLAPFTFGVGLTGSNPIGVGWKIDRGNGRQALIARTTVNVGGVFRPEVWGTDYDGERIDFSGTASLALEATFNFSGYPDFDTLTNATFALTAGTTLGEQITGDALTVTFDGPALREAGGQLAQGLELMLDPRSEVPFSASALEDLFTVALDQLEADIVVKQSRGAGFAPSYAVGGSVAAGVQVEAEAQIGTEWIASLSQTTQIWRLGPDLDGELALFKISEHPFDSGGNTAGQQVIQRTDALIGRTLDTVFARSHFGRWILAELRSEAAATVDASSEHTDVQLTLDPAERSFVDELGQSLDQIEAAIRIWAPTFLPDFIPPGTIAPPDDPADSDDSSRRSGPDPAFANVALTQEATPARFFASDVVDLAPFELTVDPAVTLSVSYYDGIEDPAVLLLHRYDNGRWRPLPTVIDMDAGTANAEITRFGTFVVASDLTPPELLPLQGLNGFAALVADAGSGIDPDTIVLTVRRQHRGRLVRRYPRPDRGAGDHAGWRRRHVDRRRRSRQQDHRGRHLRSATRARRRVVGHLRVRRRGRRPAR